MKIIFIGADYPPTGGGIATFSFELIHSVSTHKDVQNIKAYIFGNKNPRIENVNSKLRIETFRSINFFYTGIKILSIYLKNWKYDVFHSLNLFPTAFWTVFWGKIFGKKTLITFYGTDACDTTASSKTLFLKKWTISNATKALTISEFTKAQTEKKYGFGKDLIKVLYPIVPKILIKENESSNQVDDIEAKNDFKTKNNIDDNTFIVISVARLVKRKGTEYLIRAMSEIKDKNIILFVIGDGPEKNNLSDLIQKLGLNDKVKLLGKVDDIIPYYKIANVSVLPSYMIENDGDFEGLGLVLTEAQSYGIPVIGSSSGGVPEAFENGFTGIMTNERDVKSISDAIILLKNNKDLYNQYSNNTKIFLEKRFGFENTIGKYIELCKSL